MVEPSPFNHVRISEKHFRRLGEFIHKEAGIKMPPAKKTMLEARLQKRLRKLGIPSFSEYCEYLFSPEGVKNELVHMIDVVTTNKSDFFREPSHFDYLLNHSLPQLRKTYQAGFRRPLTIWSAGCATGEEPYTLAIVLSEHARTNQGFIFSLLATDISTHALERAFMGIYDSSKIEAVPVGMRKRYLLKSRDRERKKVRVVPELRSLVRFRRLNFMASDFGMRERMDIIFCRNVIIYFDRPTQEKLLNRFCKHIVPGGYVFMGHSETLSGLNIPLYPVAPTVYRMPE
jgi:chemotaxis protein methyltransferase CheR